MKIIKIIFYACVFFQQNTKIIAFKSYVTYEFSGGRFGDNLVAFCHAKWIAYKYKLNFLYKPFEYSDNMKAHLIEKKYNSQKKFSKIINFSNKDQLNTIEYNNILYIVPYFPEAEIELKLSKKTYPFSCDINWNDAAFIKLLRTTISPIHLINKIELPKDRITIAVHVRNGSGPDNEYVKAGFFWKFLPHDFYINGIKKILENNPNQKYYVYIFTDSHQPSQIVNHYKKFFANDNIIFDYRNQVYSSGYMILVDFFDMLQFDCVIRSESNFSIIAGYLSKAKIIMTPKFVVDKNQKRLSNEYNIIIRNFN